MALGVQLLQDLHHLLAAGGVECAGGFVGQDHAAAVHERTRDRHALLLPARELARAVLHAVFQAQPGEQCGGACAALRRGHAGVHGRHLDVAARRQVAQQVVALEDETEVAAPQRRERIGVERVRLAPGHAVAAAGGPVQAAQDVHQRGLARARLADDGNHLARTDVEVDVLEHGHRAFAGRKRAAQLAHGEQRRVCRVPRRGRVVTGGGWAFLLHRAALTGAWAGAPCRSALAPRQRPRPAPPCRLRPGPR